MVHRRSHAFALLALLASLGSLTACASPASPAPKTPARASHAAPDLSGPWAAEFRREYERADSDVVREALEDGRISDREFAELKTRYTACLAAGGVKLARYDQNGSTIEFPSLSSDAANAVVEKCTDETGEYPISMFYWNTRSNPDNIDTVPLIIECFKRNGLVEKGYTVEDYHAGDFPFENDPEQWEKGRLCNTDPTGRLGG